MEHKINGTKAEQAIAKEMTKHWYQKIEAWLIIANILLLMVNVFALSGPSFLRSESSPTDLLTQKATCARDGAEWVAKNIQSTPIRFVVRQNYAYASDLHTCLVSVQQDTDTGMFYDIYDIYANKQLAGYSLPDPRLGLSDIVGSKDDYLTAKNRYFSE